ncbi:deferrochelatase/peroxidase EfeB [Bradyrhizobium japonicum]|uniref:Dyp-type peroxidase n=1 Tax=Bradyrhizobium japonicum TaxID=375 RepID=UPI000576BB92|nr:Dyp-type peroxidase [Bradyrhizobium japonicum]
MIKHVLHPPLPDHTGPHQSGITDPIWPAEAPEGEVTNVYADRYAGQIERQRHLHIVHADVAVASRAELADLLRKLTEFTRHQMDKPPTQEGWRPLDPPLPNRRVSITIGFGATLFTSTQGDDRFGIAGLRPSCLKIMPQLDGDDGFLPRDVVSDLIILVASDDIYVNEYIFGRLYYGTVHPGILVRRMERGYARPDSREPSGFEDGISNPRDLPPKYEMRNLVYVQKKDSEPDWCVQGTYLGYRKVRRRLAKFFLLDHHKRDAQCSDQEAVFGVYKTTGLRVDGRSKPNPNIAPTSHAQKMNLKRGTRDLFGEIDESRRFLRRPYFFNDGLDSTGEEIRGIHHMSFVRNLTTQYEWPVLMWQTNPDFPRKGTGRDALYESGGAANIGGGYYFMPPAPGKGDHIGSALLC